jgi:AcrR family transcriptional regulator
MSSSQTTAPSRGRRTKRATGDEREQSILETLEELLKEHSFHEISIDDLARGAGISRPTFYFYFPSKEAVLLTLLDAIVSEADASSDTAQAMLENDPALYLRTALGAYFTTFGTHSNVALAASEAQATNQEVRTLWNGVRERWVAAATSAIEAERKRGAAPEGIPARDLAIALISMNEGVQFASFSGEQPAVADENVIDTLISVWLRAIYAGNPPAPKQ